MLRRVACVCVRDFGMGMSSGEKLDILALCFVIVIVPVFVYRCMCFRTFFLSFFIYFSRFFYWYRCGLRITGCTTS